ncbi:MAG: hypothetical protein HFJ54_05590 [Clostridia bacterium]|nr:hypothetical protein [Clostridia bacterium]
MQLDIKMNKKEHSATMRVNCKYCGAKKLIASERIRRGEGFGCTLYFYTCSDCQEEGWLRFSDLTEELKRYFSSDL